MIAQAQSKKITGERVVTPTGGFNPTWRRHVAAYSLCQPLLGPGRVLDLGCGVGHSYHLLAPRETIGVDIDADALVGQDRETVVADMRRLPFEDGSFSSVIAVQSIEHVPDPVKAIAETARVLEAGGVAAIVTPNRLTLGRPDEVIDPYHYVEFDAQELRRRCEEHFGEVEVLGIFGSDRYMELFRVERQTLDRVLRLDPLRLRRLVPRVIRQRLYDAMLRRYRPAHDPVAEAITVEDFEFRDSHLEESLDVCAICRLPRRTSPAHEQRVSGVDLVESPSLRPVRCVWCGSPFDGRATRLPGRTMCAQCGAATTDPWPSEAELDRAYGSWYRPHTGRRFVMFADEVLRQTRGLLANRLDRIAPPGPVLDVGAGDGALLDALRRRDRECIGLERDARRSDVTEQSLAQLDGKWAAIVFWHSLEHLPDPGDAISHAARLLAPSGVVVVAIPNTDSLQSKLFGDRWLGLELPRHLVHVPARTLIARLEASGFEVERISYVRSGQIVIGWLDGLVGALPGHPNLYQALRRTHAQSRQLGRGRQVVALGAGVALFPVAIGCAAAEIALRRSGAVYVEARLAPDSGTGLDGRAATPPARRPSATQRR